MTITLNFDIFPQSREKILIPTIAIAETPRCAYGAMQCWQAEILQIDRSIVHYQEQKNWQAVAQLQRQQAEIYNQLGEFPQAIVLLCGESDRGRNRRTSPNCDTTSAVGYAQRAKDALGELAIWGVLAESYRLNTNYHRAVLLLEKFEEYDKICTTGTTKCSPQIEGTLLEIAGKTYADRGQYYQQQAKSAFDVDSRTEARELLSDANHDRNLALEKLAASQQIAQTVTDRARVILKQLQVYDNQILALFSPLFDENEEERKQELTQIRDRREDAIAMLQSLYPQLSADLPLKFRIALSLAELADFSRFSIVNFPTFSATSCQPPLLGETRSRQLLQEALAIAEQLKDGGLKSFALGELGHLEECTHHLSLALNYTHKAQEESRTFPAIQYLWYWQAGRIWQAGGERENARYAYGKAIATLEGLRPGRLIERIRQYPRNWQFDFRDRVEPLYHQYVRLLLETSETLPQSSPQRQQLFTDASNAMEALQLVEFEEYFGEECQPAKSREEILGELLTKKTAIFRTVVLGEKTAIILERRDHPTELRWVETQFLKTHLPTFREIKRRKIPLAPTLNIAKELYDRLLTPFFQNWQPGDVETLVFIQDNLFNNIPMAALFDGEQYLVEQYAIAIVPGLTLIQPRTRKLDNLKILGFGLSTQSQIEGKSFDTLINVERELDNIKTQFSGSRQFRNAEFSREKLKQELDRQHYRVLHFATHAQFGTVSEDTFLVMGSKNAITQDNEKLTLNDLERILQQMRRDKIPDLLVLSACQTGTGNDRQTLGLGGISLRAGIPTTVASLWAVNDAATADLMSQFYANLNAGQGVAHALQQAQISLIESQRDHPYFWAAFIAIGNWL